MTNPTPLSPAAQAVWSTYESILEHECVVTKTDMKALAAALRAAVYWLKDGDGEVRGDDLLAIAAELEARP